MADLILDGKQQGDEIELFNYRHFAEGCLVTSECECGILGQ